MLFSGGASAATSPPGLGFATLAVSTAGAVTLKCTLADGSTVSQIVPVSANGQVPIYAPLYTGKGSIFGWLTFSKATRSDVQGPLLWTKTGGVTGAFYPAGFTNDIETLEALYTPPTAGSRVLDLTTALVRLEGGNLNGVTTKEMLLDALSKVTVTRPTPANWC